MADSYDLSQLEPNAFEQMVNALAIKLLGAGHSGFGPGSDGGRDGYFEGEAPYPSAVERWSGRWIIQSKFHKPHLSTDPQKWLLEQIGSELTLFNKPGSRRTWPNNWIIATNIDPSGAPSTGSYDRAKELVNAARPELAPKFHIWGGRKILDMLMSNTAVSSYYGHFLTPGHVLTALYAGITDATAELSEIIRHLVVSRFEEQRYTRLEQAGSSNDNRPGIHRLFTDLPFISTPHNVAGMGAEFLARTIAQDHSTENSIPDTPNWRPWKQFPSRARIWFVKGGPGQGKSTLSQYLCQIQRAALILDPGGPRANPNIQSVAREVKEQAISSQLWPLCARIPVSIELKDFAQWFGRKAGGEARGILTYLGERISAQLEQTVYPGTLKRAFGIGRWMFVFDGLDEVPSDVKDEVANEVINFIDDVLVGCSADAFHVCTSRPQGYSGQFGRLEACGIELQNLTSDQALECARPVLEFDRSDEDFKISLETLKEALQSPSIREIMTTPLQSHIMAVVVRDGGKPPERRWQLFSNFYQVIKKREANRKLPDRRLSKLLLDGDRLLKAVHNRLGFELHSRAETSEGAQTSLRKTEFQTIVQSIVGQLQDGDADETVSALMEATTDRLVLVSTPDIGDEVRFDIRPLQEFFAAEYIYESVNATRIGERMRIIGGDAHWREVTHFLLSALIENDRQTDLMVATEVLSEVDDLPDGPYERAFHRRMAQGAAIVSRLLAEGVLEHDKRIRQLFRRCLLPLFGTMSREFVEVLTSTAGRHSLAWLHEVLIDYILEQTDAESVVAAASLLITLTDSHARLNAVLQYFREASLPFKSVVFRLTSPEPFDEEARVFPSWAYEAVLETLLRPNWMSLGDGVGCAIDFFKYAKRDIVRLAANRVGLGSSLTDLLTKIFVAEDSIAEGGHDVVFEERFGAIAVEHFRTADDLGIDSWSDAVWADLAAAPGILHTVYLVLNLARTKSAGAVRQLVDFLGDQVRILSQLPACITNYLPMSRDFTFITDLTDLNDAEIATYLPAHMGCERRISITSEHTSATDWCDAADKMPDFVLSVLGYQDLRGERIQGIETEEVAVGIIEKCLEHPNVILRVPDIWGRLISVCPKMEEQIRTALIYGASRAKGSVEVSIWSRFHRGDGFPPLQLRLPSEARLLPHSLIALVDEVSRMHWRSHRENTIRPSLGKLVVTLSEAGLLFDVASDAEYDTTSRAAAAMLYMVHPNANPANIEECERLVITLYVPHAQNWYMRAVAATFDGQIQQQVARSAKTLGQLLLSGRSDFEGRLALEPTLERWRERSSAPVVNSPGEIWA